MDIFEGLKKYILRGICASIIPMGFLAPLLAARGMMEEEGRWENRFIFLFYSGNLDS